MNREPRTVRVITSSSIRKVNGLTFVSVILTSCDDERGAGEGFRVLPEIEVKARGDAPGDVGGLDHEPVEARPDLGRQGLGGGFVGYES